MLEPSHFIFLLPLLEIIKIASAGKFIKKLLIYLKEEKLTLHSILFFMVQIWMMIGQTQRFGKRIIIPLELLLPWIKLKQLLNQLGKIRMKKIVLGNKE